MIGTYLPGLAAGVAACVAFARFVCAGTAATDIGPLTIVGLLARPCRRAAEAPLSAKAQDHAGLPSPQARPQRSAPRHNDDLEVQRRSRSPCRHAC